MSAQEKTFLEGIFRAAIAAVDPAQLVRKALLSGPEAGRPRLDVPGFRPARGAARRIVLVGGGKAGRTMGEAAVEILGTEVSAGVLAVPRGEGGNAGPVRFVEAGHPLPDAGSREAARAMLHLICGLPEGDLVIALLSGGGSSMISAPPEGVSPADKEAAVRLLLGSGADIAEFNTVRKHLSLVKGGRMAQAARPAGVLALLLSDVAGDDPSVIASGPFSPDPTTYADAMNVLIRRGILRSIPASVSAHIDTGRAGKLPETPKPGSPVFERVACVVIGSNRTALDAAYAEAKTRPETAAVRILPGFLHGESRECARDFVAEMRRTAAEVPRGRSAVLIAGGETTVTVRGGGVGGRSQEFALSAAMEMEGEEGTAVLCAGTDGIDGPTVAAGAFADGSTCKRARRAGVSPETHLADNDACPLFQAISDLIVTGPTGTNVADIAVGVARGRP